MIGSVRTLPSLCSALLAAVAFTSANTSFAAGQFIDDIRISRRAGQVSVEIELACPMRIQSDDITAGNKILEIIVAPLEVCRQLGLTAGVTSEGYRPVGGALANLEQVEFESLGIGDNLLLLRFDAPIEYTLDQQGDLRTIELTVAPGIAPERSAADAPSIETPPAVAAAAPVAAPATSDRDPLSARLREPGSVADFVINLQSTSDPVGADLITDLNIDSSRQIYVSDVVVNGQTWHRLRVGFFATETEAEQNLLPLVESFPRAWIGRAEPEEVKLASDFEFERGATVVAVPSEAELATIIAADTAEAEALGDEQVTQLQLDGRDALLGARYDEAIRIYTRLLQQPGEHRPEAREFLGLARERAGQYAHALAEYREYLGEYPGDPGAPRVQQRLSELMIADQMPREALRSVERASDAQWDIGSGVSQYYRRDLNQFDPDQPEIVTLSALFTDVDFNVRRSGEKFDVLGRAAISHMEDLMSVPTRSNFDPTRVSYAYIDVEANEGNWELRAGRQSLHHFGVLGRFDGAHFSYDWAPDRRVHFTTGYPVESTRHSLETSRQFNGVAVEFEDLIGNWHLSTYLNNQTIEGINDRQAAGLEMSFVDEKRSLTSMVDYDLNFSELNSVLVLGTWRFENRMAVNALVDIRKSPVLTTRNALIGQPVTTIDELLLVWTEEEIRQIAIDRTSKSRNFTLGFVTPLAERFQLTADISFTEIEATTGSVGVLGIPGTGAQTFLSLSVVGSGLMRVGDVSIISLRHGDSKDFTSSQLTWDLRFPIGRHIRINPRLRFSTWEGVLGNRQRDTVSPSLRFLLNAKNRYRLEFEIGADQFVRTDSFGERESSSKFVNFGYRADF